jgi:hypothetical protein
MVTTKKDENEIYHWPRRQPLWSIIFSGTLTKYLKRFDPGGISYTHGMNVSVMGLSKKY